MAELLPCPNVSQEAREAAIQWVRGRGHGDTLSLAEAFAAFEQSIRADQRERDAKIVEQRSAELKAHAVDAKLTAAAIRAGEATGK